jgi:hypothetical protein
VVLTALTYLILNQCTTGYRSQWCTGAERDVSRWGLFNVGCDENVTSVARSNASNVR